MIRKRIIVVLLILIFFICTFGTYIYAIENYEVFYTSNPEYEDHNFIEIYPNNNVGTDNFKTSDQWSLKFNDFGTYDLKSIRIYYNDELYNVESWEKTSYYVDETKYYEVKFYLPNSLIETLGGEGKVMPRAYLEIYVGVRK